MLLYIVSYFVLQVLLNVNLATYYYKDSCQLARYFVVARSLFVYKCIFKLYTYSIDLVVNDYTIFSIILEQ